jgi:hypothetical protein
LWQEKERFEPKLQAGIASKEHKSWLNAVKAVQVFAAGT